MPRRVSAQRRDRRRMIGHRFGETLGYCGRMDLSLVHIARRLAVEINELSERAAAIADEVIWQATRERGSAEAVAQELGVSLASVRKAVQQRNNRLKKALTEGTESDTTKRAPRTKGA